jgi:hypothetical protein
VRQQLMERQEHRDSFVVLVFELLHLLELSHNVKDCSLLRYVLDQCQPLLNAPDREPVDGLLAFCPQRLGSGWIDDCFHMVVEQSQNL